MICHDELSNLMRFLYDTYYPHIEYIKLNSENVYLKQLDNSKNYYCRDFTTNTWKHGVQPIGNLKIDILNLIDFMILNCIHKIAHKCHDIWLIFAKDYSFELIVEKDQDILIKSASKLN